jgi:hypothetical protein
MNKIEGEGAQESPQIKGKGAQSQRSRSTLRKNPIQASATADQAQTVDPTHKRELTILASVRKSKDVKLLRDLDQSEAHNEKLLQQATKIDKDRKVRKEFNTSGIQAKTIEALLRFLELEPDEKPKQLDIKLNQHRIEIQGQKPNRVKKTLKNTKLDDYIQEHP